ncbi:unnamed protein product [Adineta ricciae]|uniref:Transducer of regulated CREB activity N-terminal domain-containing protein n=1 Tax=Adineta ricciae TaxID=249248 RepID=A0A814KVY2_ADIRI|nr:unnamed protein product [Adineta ricciae]
MSSPRKFAEKIALLQQKQAEDDAAFNTILYEVEAAKQKADRGSSTKTKLDVPMRKYEIPNRVNHSDNNNYTNQSINTEHDNGSDRLLQPPENPQWRRTHSDSSLHHAMMPAVVAHYHAQVDNHDNNQRIDFDINNVKLEPPHYGNQATYQQFHHAQMPVNHYYDLNNNNYPHDQTNMFYSSGQQPIAPSTITNQQHALLGPRFSGGNVNPNVLMLPPNQHPRSGGSLPDLRNENVFSNTTNNHSHNHYQQPFFNTAPASHSTNNDDLYALGPQQQLPSQSGPLKTSPSIRRRHSPIGDGKAASPRRQNSPSPDVSSTQQNHYRVEPQSPPSLSSYSPQNSPHLLASPANELSPFSPQQQQQQQQQQQSTDNTQHYFTLPNQFDQITLDNTFYTQQQQQQSPPSKQQNHSLPTTPAVSNNFAPREFYASFIDDMTPPYVHNQSPGSMSNNGNQKSPTIPNIILTDVDSSKLDLSKELNNDFSLAFDHLIDATDLQLPADDFLLNGADLSLDSNLCDDTFRMER